MTPEPFEIVPWWLDLPHRTIPLCCPVCMATLHETIHTRDNPHIIVYCPSCNWYLDLAGESKRRRAEARTRFKQLRSALEAKTASIPRSIAELANPYITNPAAVTAIPEAADPKRLRQKGKR